MRAGAEIVPRQMRQIRPERSEATRIVALLIAFYILLQLLWFVRTIVLTIFLGVLFAIAVSAGADRLQRWRIPRGAAAGLVVFAFVALLGGFGTWIGPTVREQTRELQIKLPEAIHKLEKWVDSRGGGVIATILGLGDDAPAAPTAPPVAQATTLQPLDSPAPRVVAPLDSAAGPSAAVVPVVEPEGLGQRLLAQLGGARRFFLPVLSSTLAVVAGIVLILFLSIYLAADPEVYRRGLLRLVPRHRRRQADATLGAIAITLRRWLITQFIAMLVIGVVTTAMLLVLHVRAAIPLGILAGLLEFVPTVGPILSALPAIAMGFVDSPEKAAAVAIGYIGIQFVENHLLIPLLMKEGMDLPPALTIVMQALMALVFGFLGLVVAVPLLAAIIVTVRMTGDEAKVA